MKKVKGLIIMLIIAGLGISMAFSKPVSAAQGIIDFHINISGGKFDKNSLLTPSDNKDLAQADEFEDTDQSVVYRCLKDRTKSHIGRPPKMIGKAGYLLYNQEWNTNGEQGGTLWQSFENKTFNEIFGSNSRNEAHLYLLWRVNGNDRLTLTYDSNSNGEVTNPADRSSKVAAETFSNSDLPVLKRHGYNFDAWYASNGNKVGTSRRGDSSIKITPVEADPTIYNGTDENAHLIAKKLPLTAKWQKKSGNIKVEFWDSDGRTLYSTLNNIDIWSQMTTTTVHPEKAGYRLSGWTTPDGDSIGLNDSRTPASMDINLSPGGTLKLYAQWTMQAKLTINYKDRDLNDLGIPSRIEMMDKGSVWTWDNKYAPAVSEKVQVAYRLNSGNIFIEGKPSTLSMTQDTSLDIIYGQDKVSSHGMSGSDGKEDFDIERSWEQEDGTPVNNQLTSRIAPWNTGENFDESYSYGCSSSLFKGFSYLGYYINHDKNSFHPGENPNLRINGRGQITYVFHEITYDLKIHYVDFKGKSLTPEGKILPKEIIDSQAYTIDQSKLDNFNGKSPTGWYLGAPKNTAPSLSELNDMNTAETFTDKGKNEIEITIVYDDILNVTLPLSMKFVVSNNATKAISSKNYAITNNSTSSKLLLKLDTKDDVKIDKNPAGIHLISAPKKGNSKTEELYLTLKSDLPGFGEHSLAADKTVTGELTAGQSMDLTFAGKYYGDLPDEKSPVKEFDGRLVWHFTSKVK
ncbi:hypothetical protein OfM1_16860 [Lactovum odontotermitis]